MYNLVNLPESTELCILRGCIIWYVNYTLTQLLKKKKKKKQVLKLLGVRITGPDSTWHVSGTLKFKAYGEFHTIV